MADEPRTTNYGKREKEPTQLSIPTVAALLAGVLSLGGAGGSVLSGRDVAGELREFRAEVRGELQAMRGDLLAREKSSDRLEVRVTGLEERLRALEIGRTPR